MASVWRLPRTRCRVWMPGGVVRQSSADPSAYHRAASAPRGSIIARTRTASPNPRDRPRAAAGDAALRRAARAAKGPAVRLRRRRAQLLMRWWCWGVR